MNSLLDSELCARLALALGHFVWQGALIAFVAASIAAMLRRASANTRYVVWLTALIAMSLAPLVTFGVVTVAPSPASLMSKSAGNGSPDPAFRPTERIFDGTVDRQSGRIIAVLRSDQATGSEDPSRAQNFENSTAIESPLAPNAANESSSTTAWQRLAPWAVAAYLVGVCGMLVRLAIGLWGGRAMRKRATPIRGDALADSAARIAQALGLRLAPVLAWCDEVAVPTVIGVLRPTILLPLSLTSGLAPEQVEAVLAHELAHLRRWDHLVNVLQRVIESLLFFHPAVWWVSAQIRIEREHACDDLAVSLGTPRLAYAASLLRVAELSRPALGAGLPTPPSTLVSLMATGQPSKLRQRITRLLGETSEPQVRLRPSSLVAVLAVLLVGSFFAARLALTEESPPAAASPSAKTDQAAGSGDPRRAHAGRGSPDPALDPTVGLPNLDEETNQPNNANGDPRRAPLQTKTTKAMPERLNYFTTGHSITIACSADGKLIAVANGNPTRIVQVGGTSRVAGNWKPTADILDAETGKIVVSLKLITKDEDAVFAATARLSHIEATALAFSPAGNVVAVGTSVGQVKLFNARTGELVRSLDDEPAKLAVKESPANWKSLRRAMGSVASLAFSPDGSLLAMCGAPFGDSSGVFDGVLRLGRSESVTGPGRLKVWEVKTGTLKHDLVVHGGHANAVAFSPDGNLLASAGSWMSSGGSDHGTGVIIWNPQGGAKMRTIINEANGGTHAVAFSPNSKLVVIGSRVYDKDSDTSTTTVTLAHAGTGIVEWQHSVPGWANPKAFSPDGKSVLVLCAQSVRFLDTATGTVKREIKSTDMSRDGRWNDLAIAPQGPWLVIGAVDEVEGSVELWDLDGPGAAANSAPVKDGAAEKRAEKPDSPASTPPVMKPKHQSGQGLFKKWQDSARTDGKIPGGALGSLAGAVANFIKLNPPDERVPKLTELLKRIDTSHDWTQADAVALLDDLTDIYPTLPEWVGAHGSSIGSPIRPGEPLPAELKGAAWGQPAANGLRAAWLLEPGTAQHPLGTNLKSRILFHNSGKETVVFRTPDWHQYPNHKASDAKGAAIDIWATEWTRLSTLVPIRLAPGEYAEVEAHGIAIGPKNKAEENWAGLRVGAWIEAKEGDEVTFQPAAVGANEDRWTMPADRRTPAEQWKAIVRERIDREAPMPAGAADREQLIRRVMPDLIGVSPTKEEIAAFAADDSPDALSALAKRLVPRIAPFAGDLPVGEIKFRVTAADPDAAKKPRVATGPNEGWYTLGDHVRLSIVQKRDGNRRMNEASILFFSPDPKAEPPGKPHEIKLPDGHLTWAAAWERGSTVLWVAQKGLVRKYDFTNPAQVKETQLDEADFDKVPKAIMEALSAGGPQESQKPKGKEAQSLFKRWQEGARANGNIPGGALGPLVRVMTNFIKNNPTHEGAPKFAELLKRIDTSHDWTPADAIKLLDEVTAIYASLPEWVEGETRFTLGGAIQTGQPLPDELKNAPWGEAQPNGLRVAWLLEPRALKYRLGTPLKSRLLFHNAGKNSVVFRALTWNQSGSHKAHDANGEEVNIVSTSWTTIPRTVACRLAPGEYMEVTAAGIGVGANKDNEDWIGTRVGSWIETKAGDEVTFMPAPVSAHGQDHDEPLPDAPLPREPLIGKSQWWLDFITDRLSFDRPLPADAAERGRLLDRAMRDLFGNAPTPEEITAFTTDAAPDALEALAKRLASRAGFTPFSGSLKSGTRKFLVLPVDPDAAKKPRTAKNPGRYTLGGNATLVVVRRPVGERIVNEAHIAFAPTDATKPAPREPHPVPLPDGYNTWAAAWERGATVLWVQQKGTVRSYDFTNPAKVQETQLAEPDFDKVPKPILEALRAELIGDAKVIDAPKGTGAAQILNSPEGEL